jgi:hypothetical protein
VAAVIALAPWVGYNLTRFERPVYMSGNFGSTLIASNCHSTFYGSSIGFKDYACARAVVQRESRVNPRWDKLDESERDHVLRTVATRYIKDHKGRLPVVVAARWGRIAGVYKPIAEIDFDAAILKQPSWLGYLLLFSYYVVVVLAIVGLFVMRRLRIAIWPLVAIPVIVLISVTTTFAQVRYRAPAEAAFVIAAAVALDAAFSWRSRHRSGATQP